MFCGILFIASIVLFKSSITGRRAEIVIGGRANDIYHQDWGPKYPSADSVASVKEQIATPQPVQPQIQPLIIQPQPIIQPQNTINPANYAFCPKCGTQLGTGYAFCPKCGFKF
ncbi:MAG: zinc ribbon domain-containing protein [Candidatus Riflebacteria bacterium]|nr:zinc ribbon domain-containing protein [Candidatus Riflebacteria bacterium]